MNTWINDLQKKVRAEVIQRHLHALGQNRCVCFTCGNAAEKLRRVGLDVVAVGTGLDLQPGRWFGYTDVARSFNGLFDATSGHLPVPFMAEIGTLLARKLGPWRWDTRIPTGSGETIVCLKMGYPSVGFTPVSDGTPATAQHELAPLAKLVALIAGGTVGTGE